MALSLRARVSLRILSTQIRCMSQTGQWGEGAGRGGGAGGSIREAGGAFGKREAAEEEWYFRKLQQEQLKKMRERSEDEVEYHAKQIGMHKEAIERHKKKIGQIKHEEDEVDKKEKK